MQRRNRYPPPPDKLIVEVVVEDKKIAFDLGDRWMLASKRGKEYLSQVSAYFARGYDQTSDIVNPNSEHYCEKVKPFGFDFYATYPTNPLDTLPTNILAKLKMYIAKIVGYDKCMYSDYFEQNADYKSNNFNIIFYCRLWDANSIIIDDSLPEDVIAYRKYMKQEWQAINEMRIGITRQLRANYGKAFRGGIQESELAKRICPELIVPTHEVRKKSYLDKMKNSDICIGSMGLHKSTGWKTGEYIAAARAIVAEQLQYDVPGNFQDGVNYLAFNSIDGCLEAVDKLYRNPDAIYRMKKANEVYYNSYLKIDRQILNAISQVIPIDF